MKELELAVACDFSEAAIEAAILAMRNHHHKEVYCLELTVSVFDVRCAIRMMIDDHIFSAIRDIKITPNFEISRWRLEDSFNECFVTSCA